MGNATSVAPAGFYEALTESTAEELRLVAEWVAVKVPASEQSEVLRMLGILPPETPADAPADPTLGGRLCADGRHEVTPANTFTYTSGRTRCLLCKREMERVYRAGLRARRNA